MLLARDWRARGESASDGRRRRGRPFPGSTVDPSDPSYGGYDPSYGGYDDYGTGGMLPPSTVDPTDTSWELTSGGSGGLCNPDQVCQLPQPGLCVPPNCGGLVFAKVRLPCEFRNIPIGWISEDGLFLEVDNPTPSMASEFDGRIPLGDAASYLMEEIYGSTIGNLMCKGSPEPGWHLPKLGGHHQRIL